MIRSSVFVLRHASPCSVSDKSQEEDKGMEERALCKGSWVKEFENDIMRKESAKVMGELKQELALIKIRVKAGMKAMMSIITNMEKYKSGLGILIDMENFTKYHTNYLEDLVAEQ